MKHKEHEGFVAFPSSTFAPLWLKLLLGAANRLC